MGARPTLMQRFPDGASGKSFFQKDAPSFAPGWVRLERVWSESAEREIDYFVADDVETLTKTLLAIIANINDRSLSFSAPAVSVGLSVCSSGLSPTKLTPMLSA